MIVTLKHETEDDAKHAVFGASNVSQAETDPRVWVDSEAIDDQPGKLLTFDGCIVTGAEREWDASISDMREILGWYGSSAPFNLIVALTPTYNATRAALKREIDAGSISIDDVRLIGDEGWIMTNDTL